MVIIILILNIAQRIEHEEQLAKLKQELPFSVTTPTPFHPKYKITTYVN